ncbi:C2 domain-containing protein 3 [Pelomyxa schiedti]|nr:C2 domain-containing protein 3 [Pelomyxa schiedti]
MLLEQIFFNPSNSQVNSKEKKDPVGASATKSHRAAEVANSSATSFHDSSVHLSPAKDFLQPHNSSQNLLLHFHLRYISLSQSRQIIPQRSAHIVVHLSPGLDLITPQFTHATCANFNFSESVPLNLSAELLQHLQHNNVIMELWSNKRVLGIGKIPLHKLYLALSNSTTGRTVLSEERKYAAVVFNDAVNISLLPRLVSGGYMHVLLAAGSLTQIRALSTYDKAALCIQRHYRGYLVRKKMHIPIHKEKRVKQTRSLESLKLANKKNITTVNHVFDVTILQLRVPSHLTQFLSNAYVSYIFPTKSTPISTQVAHPEKNYSREIVYQFTFHSQHNIILPMSSSLSNTLKSALIFTVFNNVGSASNIFGMASIQPSQLHHLTSTGTSKGHHSGQFQLPVALQVQGIATNSTTTCILCVEFQYHSLLGDNESSALTYTASPSPLIESPANPTNMAISVSVLRCAGLQEALSSLASNSTFQYTAQVGLNVYVAFSIFGTDTNSTPVVVHTFCPEFLYHSSVEVPFEDDSLEQHLLNGKAVFEVWHRVPNSSGKTALLTVSSRKQTAFLLGRAIIQLSPLLFHNTISGWFNIQSPHSEAVVGAVQLSLKLGSIETVSDQPIVHTAPRIVGLPDFSLTGSTEAAVIIEGLTIPQTPKHHYYVFTYSFFKHGSVSTSPVGLSGSSHLDVQHSHSFQQKADSTFLQFILGEQLEIQVWGGSDTVESSDYLGSAFIPLTALSDALLCSSKGTIISIGGTYNVINPKSDISSFRLKVRVTLIASDESPVEVKPALPAKTNDTLMATSANSTRKPDGSQDLPHRDMKLPEDGAPNNIGVPQVPTLNRQVDDRLDNHPHSEKRIRVMVERAVRLPAVFPIPHGDAACPTAYVAFEWSGNISSTPLFSTPIVTGFSPVWHHTTVVQYTEDTLLRKNAIFKVWHKDTNKSGTTPSELLLGTAEVNLVNLDHLQEIHGWYNLFNSNKQIQGQLEVCVSSEEVIGSPLFSVTTSIQKHSSSIVSHTDTGQPSVSDAIPGSVTSGNIFDLSKSDRLSHTVHKPLQHSQKFQSETSDTGTVHQPRLSSSQRDCAPREQFIPLAQSAVNLNTRPIKVGFNTMAPDTIDSEHTSTRSPSPQLNSDFQAPNPTSEDSPLLSDAEEANLSGTNSPDIFPAQDSAPPEDDFNIQYNDGEVPMVPEEQAHTPRDISEEPSSGEWVCGSTNRYNEEEDYLLHVPPPPKLPSFFNDALVRPKMSNTSHKPDISSNVPDRKNTRAPQVHQHTNSNTNRETTSSKNTTKVPEIEESVHTVKKPQNSQHDIPSQPQPKPQLQPRSQPQVQDPSQLQQHNPPNIVYNQAMASSQVRSKIMVYSNPDMQRIARILKTNFQQQGNS